MSAAPTILASEELSTREARNVVFVSSEEILPRKIPAYVRSKSEISFLFRQPSASAIMINRPFIELELQFVIQKKLAGAANAFVNSDTLMALGEHPLAGARGNEAYGRAMEGLPFLSKCVRTSVISINGATQTYRNSEIFTPYLRTQIGREAMRKLNVGWNEFSKNKVGGINGYSSRAVYNTLSKGDSEQVSQFVLNTSMEQTVNGFEAPVPAVVGTMLSKRMHFHEPLFMGIFGGLQGNAAFPLWSCEQNKSPSILHAQNVTINLNLLDNWAQNLYGLVQLSAMTNQADQFEVVDVIVHEANLCCTYVQPPPKFIASSLSSNVTYASTKFLRFEREAVSGTTQMNPIQHNGAPSKFVFQVVSFPYMPSCFMIEIQPDYNTKSKRIGKSEQAGGGAAEALIQTEFNALSASKEDKRMAIVSLDLIINTSPDVVPSHGANAYSDANIINVRYNSRQLYKLYLKNCASVERAIYSYDQWFRSGCTVLLTPADFNGILTPAHCRGNISVSGTINAVNLMGYSVYVGNGSPAQLDGNQVGASWGSVPAAPGPGQPRPGTLGVVEKFRAAIIAVYSNSYVALDAKSGLVGENVMSEQFAAGLRLSNI